MICSLPLHSLSSASAKLSTNPSILNIPSDWMILICVSVCVFSYVFQLYKFNPLPNATVPLFYVFG